MNTSRNYDTALLLLRLVFGAAMLYGHGWGKLLRLFGDEPVKFSDPFGIGPEASLALVVFAEFFCSILIMAGWFTRLALVPLIITMLVAVFYAHWGDPFDKMEKGLMYLTVFISLLLTGPGWYSVDGQLRNRP